MPSHCPACRQPYLQRVNREGWGERALSAVFVYPYRCQVCTHRFFALDWGHRYTKEHVDVRQYERLPVQCPAWYTVAQTGGPDRQGEATVTDLSIGGCGMEVRFPFEPGMLCSLEIQTWEDQLPVRVESAIVRVVRPKVVGVEFLELRPAEKQRLSQFMQGLLLINRR